MRAYFWEAIMKFRYFSAALFSMLCFFASTTYACSCGGYSSFKQAYDDKYTDLVVHAKVLGYIGASERNPRELVSTLEEGHHSAYVQIQIIDTLKGVSDGPIMTIRGDGGLDCIKYASSFPTGSEWIFAIPRVILEE
jgi:hypothetical protein